MARTKKKGRKPAKAKVTTQLPKGYDAIGGFGTPWPNDNTQPGDMIQGTLTDFDEFTTGRGKEKRTTQTVKIETKDGLFTFYESAGSRELFEYEEGTEVAIIFDGMGPKKKGRNPAKLYRIGVK